jgi:prolipoprotein diacylglyceryltransferase
MYSVANLISLLPSAYGLAYIIGFFAIGLSIWKAIVSDSAAIEESFLNRLPSFMLTIAVGTFIGAKIAYCIETLIFLKVTTPLLSSEGMSSFGAITGCTASVAIFCKLSKTSFLSTLDLVAVGGCIGIMLIRFSGGLDSNDNAQFLQLFGEGIIQGFLPFLLGLVLFRKYSLKRHGLTASVLLLVYIATRAISESYRSHEVDFGGYEVVRFWAILLIPAGLSALMYSLKVSNAALGIRTKPTIRPGVPSIFLKALPAYAFYVLLTGCGTAPKPSIPNAPVVYTDIIFTNPSADPSCACGNSRGAYATNTDTIPHQFAWTVYATDTSSGQFVRPQPGSRPLPARNTDGTPSSTFLGCTIYEPTSAPTCKFNATYVKTSAPSPSFIQPKAGIAAIYGIATTPSLSSCKTWCAAPESPTSGPCLPLGVRYYPVVAPLTTLLDRVDANGGIVKKDDLLKDYHKMPADDKCNRNDIVTQHGKLVNEGAGSPTEYCQVTSQDLDPIVLRALNRRGYVTSQTSMTMNGFIPHRIEATPLPQIAGFTSGRIVQFETESTAPIIKFSGTDGDVLSRAFGGVVMASTRVPLNSGKSQVIVATTNGCISVEEP